MGTFCSISNIWCIRIVIPSRRTSSARSCICRLFTRRCVQEDCRASWRMSRLSRADTTRWRLRAAGPRECGNSFRARASITAWSRTGGWMSAAIRTSPRGRRRIISTSFIRCSTTGIWRLRPTTRGKERSSAGSPLPAPRRSLSCAARTSRFTVSGIACPMRTNSISPSFWLSAR